MVKKKWFNHKISTLKPVLKDYHKMNRLKYALSFISSNLKFDKMYEYVHIDEKWVDIIEPIYLASLEPYLLEKSKQYNKKLSRLCCQIEIKNEYDGLIVHLLESW